MALDLYWYRQKENCVWKFVLSRVKQVLWRLLWQPSGCAWGTQCWVFSSFSEEQLLKGLLRKNLLETKVRACLYVIRLRFLFWKGLSHKGMYPDPYFECEYRICQCMKDGLTWTFQNPKSLQKVDVSDLSCQLFHFTCPRREQELCLWQLWVGCWKELMWNPQV